MASVTSQRRRIWWWMIPILLLTFWLGAHYLNANPVWGDERNSVRDAGGLFFGPLSPLEIWERVATGNPWHSPGFFLILGGWGSLVGWTLPALRTLSLLFGMLAVAWTYRLGADTLSRQTGLYGAAILSTSMVFAHYLSTARMYTLMAVLSVFTVWAYLRIVNAAGKIHPLMWVGLFIGALGLFYTHYFSPLLLIALGLYHLLFVAKHDGAQSGLIPTSRRWWGVVGVFALAGVLFLPWIGALTAGLEKAAAFDALHERAIDPLQTVERLGFLFGNGSHVLTIVTLGLALAGLFWLRDKRGLRQMWFILAALLIVILLTNGVVQVMHEGRLRYLIGLWSLLALLAGLALTLVARLPYGRYFALIGLALWMGLGVYQVSARLVWKDTNKLDVIYPMHRVAAAVDGHIQVGDLVINTILVDELPDIDSPLNEYNPMREFYFPPDTANLMLQVAGDNDQQEDEQDDTFDFIAGRVRFWLAYQPNAAPVHLGDFQSRLEADYNLCRTVVDQPDLRIDFYTRLPLCCANDDRDEPAIAQYGDGIRLTGIEVQPARDGMLPVVTTWAIDGGVPVYTYSVALHAWDSDENLVTQHDFGLELPAYSCREALLPVADLPPGDYQLRATVYAWETGERLPGRLTANDTTGDLLPVGTFSIDE